MGKPASFMMERTSAKSRLMKAGMLIRLEMLSTPWRSTLSAASKAFIRVIFSWLMSFRRSLGMTIRESTCIIREAMPCSACAILRLPSKAKGFVTMPTVRIPRSWAVSATTGAAPVPVPPPMPAVIKTICAPFSALVISSLLSSAARWPISGSAPAPRPFGQLGTKLDLLGGLELSRACWSVFIATNSTPDRPDSTMRVDGVAAAATYADNLDIGYILHFFVENECHECIPLKVML